MVVSFVASIIAEVVSLGLYYPFDLIKTRMQANHGYYNYNGTLDAVFKIFSENRASTLDPLSIKENTVNVIRGIRNFYKGMALYCFSYSAFVAL